VAAVIPRRILHPAELGRAGPRRQAARRAVLMALLLSGGLAALPAAAGDTSPPAPSTLIDFEALDTSRPPAGGNWVVLAASEGASWRDQVGEGWRRFQQGQVLMPGSEIETGPGGEVILVTGGDQVRVAPGTRVMLPGFAGDRQRLRHERGRLRVDVEPRPGRAFELTTPLLSLGIKGTSFETAVGQEQDTVLVLDGEVEVRAVGADEPFRLGDGQGLHQPRAPGAEPLPFMRPATGADRAPGQPTPWHLEGEAGPDLGSESAAGTGAAALPDRAIRSKGRSPAAERSWFGGADDGTSMAILAALAAAVVLLLAAPLRALCRALFEHWLGRPARARRRRELIRG
jgi:hypothetical protein